MYNARPCIIPTPILGLYFKKKRRQKTEEVVTKKYRKNNMIWKHSKNKLFQRKKNAHYTWVNMV